MQKPIKRYCSGGTPPVAEQLSRMKEAALYTGPGGIALKLICKASIRVHQKLVKSSYYGKHEISVLYIANNYIINTLLYHLKSIAHCSAAVQ